MGTLHHRLFTGVTLSGKTTAARVFSRKYCAARIPVVVFDPTASTETAGGDWGDEAIVFTDADTFLEYVDTLYQDISRGVSERRQANPEKFGACMLFVDEADEIFSQSQRENFWLAKKGRHSGVYCNIITQRPKMIAPTVRNQCAEAWVFRLAFEDMRTIGADYGHDLSGEILDKGDYLRIISGASSYTRGNIFRDLSPKRKRK